MTSEDTLNGNTIPHSDEPYRALHLESQAARKEETEDVQLIIQYLDRLKANNPGSVIGYTGDNDFVFKDLHVNGCCASIRQIQMDTAHCICVDN